MERISAIVPTMWRANQFFFEMLTLIEGCDSVAEVIIIDNDTSRTPTNFLSSLKKVRRIAMEKNSFFNPSMNLGYKESKNNLLCLLSDDVVFHPHIFNVIAENMTESMGLISPNPDHFNRPQEEAIEMMKNLNLTETIVTKDGFGVCMFVHKNNYELIPEELVHHFGDQFLVTLQKYKHKRINYTLNNWVIYTPMRVTTKVVPEVHPVIAKDWSVYKDVFLRLGLPTSYSPS